MTSQHFSTQLQYSSPVPYSLIPHSIYYTKILKIGNTFNPILIIHMYADDTQLYVACDPADRHETLKKLEGAITEIRH